MSHPSSREKVCAISSEQQRKTNEDVSKNYPKGEKIMHTMPALLVCLDVTDVTCSQKMIVFKIKSIAFVLALTEKKIHVFCGSYLIHFTREL